MRGFIGFNGPCPFLPIIGYKKSLDSGSATPSELAGLHQNFISQGAEYDKQKLQRGTGGENKG